MLVFGAYVLENIDKEIETHYNYNGNKCCATNNTYNDWRK